MKRRSHSKKVSDDEKSSDTPKTAEEETTNDGAEGSQPTTEADFISGSGDVEMEAPDQEAEGEQPPEPQPEQEKVVDEKPVENGEEHNKEELEGEDKVGESEGKEDKDKDGDEKMEGTATEEGKGGEEEGGKEGEEKDGESKGDKQEKEKEPEEPKIFWADLEPSEVIPDVNEPTTYIIPDKMITKRRCNVCDAAFTGVEIASEHYKGRRHVNQSIEMIKFMYNKLDLPDMSRFLHEPTVELEFDEEDLARLAKLEEAKANALKEAERPPAEPLDDVPQVRIEDINAEFIHKWKFACSYCGICWQEPDYVEAHQKTAMHAVRVWEYQQAEAGYTGGYYKKAAKLRRKEGFTIPDEFYCSICFVELNSVVQYDQHIISKRHQAKEKELMDKGYLNKALMPDRAGPGQGRRRARPSREFDDYDYGPPRRYGGGGPRGGGGWDGYGDYGGGYGRGPPRGGRFDAYDDYWGRSGGGGGYGGGKRPRDDYGGWQGRPISSRPPMLAGPPDMGAKRGGYSWANAQPLGARPPAHLLNGPRPGGPAPVAAPAPAAVAPQQQQQQQPTAMAPVAVSAPRQSAPVTTTTASQPQDASSAAAAAAAAAKRAYDEYTTQYAAYAAYAAYASGASQTPASQPAATYSQTQPPVAVGAATPYTYNASQQQPSATAPAMPTAQSWHQPPSALPQQPMADAKQWWNR